jgi:superfamily I DNA/RNA helicase
VKDHSAKDQSGGGKWLAPSPAPLSPWKYSQNSITSLLKLASPHPRTRPTIQPLAPANIGLILLRALRHTYPHVFIDECQDTIYAQYDFLLSLFGADRVCVTAVGDDKQRIMGWAGTVPEVFARLARDFGAEGIQLLCNYRSSPELVRIQHVLAEALDSRSRPFNPARSRPSTFRTRRGSGASTRSRRSAVHR